MMRRQLRIGSFAGGLLLVAAGLTADGQNAAPSKPLLMATRLYTGADGQSHIDQVPIAVRDSSGVPAREDSDSRKMSEAYLVRCAPGMFENWHNADQKRYIVVLGGEAEVTTTGGEKASIVPGHLYIAEDLTGKGHTFRVVGHQDWVALFANFAP
jgi:quercetin dioxygenase-like cupin family protein